MYTTVWRLWARQTLRIQWLGDFGLAKRYKNNTFGAPEAPNVIKHHTFGAIEAPNVIKIILLELQSGHQVDPEEQNYQQK